MPTGLDQLDSGKAVMQPCRKEIFLSVLSTDLVQRDGPGDRGHVEGELGRVGGVPR